MKIGRGFSGITEEERTKVAHLPVGDIAYLEILSYTVNPATGLEGEVIYNSTDEKFYLWQEGAFVEVLFTMSPTGA